MRLIIFSLEHGTLLSPTPPPEPLLDIEGGGYDARPAEECSR
jgi:hypothetical protein